MMRLLLILVIAVSYTAYHYVGSEAGAAGDAVAAQAKPLAAANVGFKDDATAGTHATASGEALIAQAYASHSSHLQVAASGTVSKLLPDDTRAPRHQRFLLKLDNGISLLFAHNIDLAERVADLNVGDIVGFSGEYAWNQKGGIVHWTHHDPQGRHAAGWLKHNGKTYQ